MNEGKIRFELKCMTGRYVLVEIPQESDLTEARDAFEAFLKAVGFHPWKVSLSEE